MANTSSAKKAVRVQGRKTEVNRRRRSEVRTYLRRVEEAIQAGDQKAALEQLRQAESLLMRAVNRGVFHKNTGARKVSRLAKRVKGMADA